MRPIVAPPAGGDAGAENLRRLLMLRWVALGAGAAALVLLPTLWGLRLPTGAVLVPMALSAAAGVAGQRRLRRAAPVSEAYLLAQVVLDVAALTGVLYLTGGAFNPFTVFYFVPVAVAAALGPRAAWGMAALTVTCYTGLVLFHRPLPLPTTGALTPFVGHVLGMWAGFAAGAVVIAAVVAAMGRTLRSREQVLARMREQALRDEHLLAMGTLAAGAAHELGTPLATMAVVLGELERERGGDAELMESVRLLRAQVAQCRQRLEELARAAGGLAARAGRRTALADFLAGVVEAVRAAHPRARIRWAWDGPGGGTDVYGDRGLASALAGIVGNAAEASPGAVSVRASLEAGQVRFEVEDAGSRDKPAGLGIGLVLATSVLERLGGGLEMRVRPGGGTRAVAWWPLAAVAVGGATGEETDGGGPAAGGG